MVSSFNSTNRGGELERGIAQIVDAGRDVIAEGMSDAFMVVVSFSAGTCGGKYGFHPGGGGGGGPRRMLLTSLL